MSKPQRREAVPESETLHAQGREEGYRQGLEAGRQAFGVPWPGTSIIIPTFNKRGYLEACLDSILAHTPEPYEIIVVDNGSSDGTAEMLERRAAELGFGRLRWRRMGLNAGFAAAVNRGLMMARGEKLLLLNNDTLVAPRWLDNLTACLEGVPDAGIVGPVTNFISGEQRIDVPYRTIPAMKAWAASFNEPDPGRWRETARLTGFCMLMRRGLLGEIGYFDEGYEVGNYEDDDFSLRARLAGYRLAIAGDAFIHHYGNVSIRSIGRRMEAVTVRNRRYFHAKWEGADSLPQAARPQAAEAAPGELALYPGGIAAEAADGTLWWLESGRRWRIEGEWTLPSARLAMPVLRRLPISAEPVPAELAAVRWHGLPEAPPLPDVPVDEAVPPPEAVLLPDGSVGLVEEGRLRRPLNRFVAAGWSLERRPVRRRLSSAEAEAIPAGAAIAAAPQLRQRL
ncbi:glycosyltransferase family 2 protein [Paenibacillus albicereus]|uniref:Glycosyltransferase family 2 protein n=1 Tax=Paenibacillus albicereus TaxID=2726185 RepID=A0A6H2GVI4_9BACL|nr:glycosyltransferase family 2 protein [Paenibacillus albicereus]QJC51402.1 glycosyltransferase family 2 protein [Paenibacillus albicereus]